MKEEQKCPICEEPTRVYMGHPRKDKLCGKHADELKKGLIIVNEKGLFLDSKSKKILNKGYKDFPYNNDQEKSKDSDNTNKNKPLTKCIACGKPTINGFFFCPECYRKYKEKRLLVEIKNCVDIEILDDSYEGKYVCDDGHVVKSKSEMIIDNILFEKGVPHAYEKALPIDANSEHDLHPDFCLPNYNKCGSDVYIEHWGFNENNIKYTNSKKYKIEKYRQLGITLICTNEKDMSDPKTSLTRKLDYYVKDKINFAE